MTTVRVLHGVLGEESGALHGVLREERAGPCVGSWERREREEEKLENCQGSLEPDDLMHSSSFVSFGKGPPDPVR